MAASSALTRSRNWVSLPPMKSAARWLAPARRLVSLSTIIAAAALAIRALCCASLVLIDMSTT
jgi:hypothetical protein